MGSTGTSSAGAATNSQTTSKYNLGDVENKNFLKNVSAIRWDYDNRLDSMTAASDSAKATWQARRDAAQRIIDYGGLPKLLTGDAAAVVFEALPSGSLISVSGANDMYDGTWIRGNSRSSGPVWTQVSTADGSTEDAGRHKSPEMWTQNFGKGNMKIVRYGERKKQIASEVKKSISAPRTSGGTNDRIAAQLLRERNKK